MSASSERRAYVCHPRAGTVTTEVLIAGIEGVFDPVWHPILVLGHHSWFTVTGALTNYAKLTFIHSLFEVSRTPAIRIVHPALAAVCCVKLRQGDPLEDSMMSGGGDESSGSIGGKQEVVAIVAPVPVLEEDGVACTNNNPRFRHATFAPKATPQANGPTQYEVTLVDKRTLTVLRSSTVLWGELPPPGVPDIQQQFTEAFSTTTTGANNDDEITTAVDPPQVYLQLMTHVSSSDPAFREASGAPLFPEGLRTWFSRDTHQDLPLQQQGYRDTVISLFEERAKVKPTQVLEVEDTFFGICGLINTLDFRDCCVFRPVSTASDLFPPFFFVSGVM